MEGPVGVPFTSRKMLFPRFGERNEGNEVCVIDKAGIIIQTQRVSVRIMEYDERVTQSEMQKGRNLRSFHWHSKELQDSHTKVKQSEVLLKGTSTEERASQ